MQVGMFSVGGGYAAIPLIQDQIVNILQLMSIEEFSDLIAIAEMTPGPISINSSTFVGMQLGGIPGVLVCTLGCIIPSFVICLSLAHFYYKYRSFSGIQIVLASLRPAVVALIASAGFSILALGIFKDGVAAVANLQYIELSLFAVCLFLLRKYNSDHSWQQRCRNTFIPDPLKVQEMLPLQEKYACFYDKSSVSFF